MKCTQLLAAIGDPVARARLDAERAVVETLDTSCYTPVGAHAHIDGDQIDVHAYAGLPDGSEWITDRLIASASDPATAGTELARRMLTAGAGELLRRAAGTLGS